MSSEAALLGDSSKVGAMKYKETQIHGEICFTRHVERLVANVKHRERGEEDKLKAICDKHGWKFSWMDQEKKRMEEEEIHKLGADAWRERMSSVHHITPETRMPEGFCRMGCGRKVHPGLTTNGKPWSTCCRGCALGFGHSLNCGSVDSSKLGEGLCRNGCGRPVAQGCTPSGRPLTTCCRGCSTSGAARHDANCGKTILTNQTGMCIMGCGRPMATGKGGRKFVTCCRPCATSQGFHAPDCPLK